MFLKIIVLKYIKYIRSIISKIYKLAVVCLVSDFNKIYFNDYSSEPLNYYNNKLFFIVRIKL